MRTTCQLLRDLKVSCLTQDTIDTMQRSERIDLEMAFNAGQRKTITFDTWYERTFTPETE